MVRVGDQYLAGGRMPKRASEVAAAINQTIAANGGKPFRRIIIISHAGGSENGPSVSPGGKRLTATEFENDEGGLSTAIKNGLSPDGVLVLASCGYYWEEPIPGLPQSAPYRLRGTGTPAQIQSDQNYQPQFWKNLGTIATAIGHPVFIDPVKSFPSANPNLAGSDRWYSTWGPPRGTPIRRLGVAPSGSKLW